LRIANPVAIGVHPLRSVKRESIDVRSYIQKETWPFWGADIIPRCVLIIVTAVISIGIVPLCTIIRERVTRLIQMKLGTIEVKVVIVAETISIGVDPLKRVCRIGVTVIRPSVSIAIWATKAVLC
tara:strand:+ start:129 stop:503 length:375 start_codon:yes stop_codon:yes gene_type:complete